MCALFIDFEKFKLLSEFPRYPDNKDLCTPFDFIERENTLLVYISHNWLRESPDSEGYTGKPHPDNIANEQFKLCVLGILKAHKSLAPDMAACYVWIDYSCLDQDSDYTSAMVTQLENVMSLTDCIFTPIYGVESNTATIVKNMYEDYHVSTWDGPEGYLNNAWTRAEMFYSSNLPVYSNPARASKFRLGLKHHVGNGTRCHLLFGASQVIANQIPVVLPPLSNAYLTRLSPINGRLTNEARDRPRIAQLMGSLNTLSSIREEYSGEYNAEGKYHGKGMFKYASGDVYDGEWKNGKMDGQGLYKFADGDIYEGEYKNGLFEGYGEYKFSSGALYKGEHVADRKHGMGVYRYANGTIYEGEWVNGEKNGKGSCKYTSGAVYIGEWKDDKYHGVGEYKYASGDVYTGEYKQGKFCGIGVYKYADGTVYEGEFRDDKRHGKGVLRAADGNPVYEGSWRNGNPLNKSGGGGCCVVS